MIARPTPVLPEVGSTITPPSRSRPSRSAVSIIRRAMRSLTEPPGFRYSILASTSRVLATPFVTDLSRSKGVLPIASVKESYTSTPRSYRLRCDDGCYRDVDTQLFQGGHSHA